MLYDIWNTLGIEPTTNKKEIQQAYADKLKIYHPEENPEEFQRLQSAYRAAIAYTKKQSVPMSSYDNAATYEPVKKKTESVKTVRKQRKEEVFEEEKEKLESEEALPEYIVKLGDADIHELKAEDIKKYVELLKEQLTRKKGKENLNEIEHLFDTIRFRAALYMNEFHVKLRNETKYISKWNQDVLQLLLKKISQLMNEESGQSLKELYFYLEAHVDKKEGQKYLLVMLAIIAGFFFSIWCLYSGSDGYILKNSPQPQEVCEIVYEKYGIQIEPEDIIMQYVENRNIATKENNPKVVEYRISYEEGEKFYTFSGIYFPREKSKITFDLEEDIITEYVKDYLDCEFYPNWNVLLMEGFLVKAQIEDTEEKEAFVEQFKVMLDNLFHDSRMKNSDYVFLVDVAIDEVADSVILSLDKNDYVEKCSTLSEELEQILQEAIIHRMYEEGEYSPEEYAEKLWHLESETYQESEIEEDYISKIKNGDFSYITEASVVSKEVLECAYENMSQDTEWIMTDLNQDGEEDLIWQEKASISTQKKILAVFDAAQNGQCVFYDGMDAGEYFFITKEEVLIYYSQYFGIYDYVSYERFCYDKEWNIERKDGLYAWYVYDSEEVLGWFDDHDHSGMEENGIYYKTYADGEEIFISAATYRKQFETMISVPAAVLNHDSDLFWLCEDIGVIGEIEGRKNGSD